MFERWEPGQAVLDHGQCLGCPRPAEGGCPNVCICSQPHQSQSVCEGAFTLPLLAQDGLDPSSWQR